MYYLNYGAPHSTLILIFVVNAYYNTSRNNCTCYVVIYNPIYFVEQYYKLSIHCVLKWNPCEKLTKLLRHCKNAINVILHLFLDVRVLQFTKTVATSK